MECDEQEIKLRDIAAVFKKRWKLILLPSILAAIVASGYIRTQPKTYESYALIRVGGSQEKPLENAGTINMIMQSYPMRVAISEKMKKTQPPYTPEALEDVIQYEDESGLLKIYAAASTPETAAELVTIATDMISVRHQQLYVNTKAEMDALVTYIKNTVKPISIIATSIVELRLAPTTVEIPAVVNTKPIALKNQAIPWSAFFLVFFIMTLIAFYRESSIGAVGPAK